MSPTEASTVETYSPTSLPESVLNLFGLVEALWTDCLRSKRASASNPSTPEWVLSEFAMSPEVSVRASLLNNPELCVDLLHTLSSDSSWVIRKLVASHRNTSTFTLNTLSNDYISEVADEASARLYKERVR